MVGGGKVKIRRLRSWERSGDDCMTTENQFKDVFHTGPHPSRVLLVTDKDKFVIYRCGDELRVIRVDTPDTPNRKCCEVTVVGEGRGVKIMMGEVK